MLSELNDESEWLSNIAWRLDQLQLVAEFTIRIGASEIECKLAYPEFFPDVPPSLTPKEDVLLSGHQYGRGGELCLEHRADNWDPAITGAMMVASAYRLLNSESPVDAPPIESAHRTTLGQRLRGSKFRFYVDAPSRAGLARLQSNAIYEGAISEIRNGETWVVNVARIGPKDEPTFVSSPSIPEGHSTYEARILRISDDEKLPPTLTEQTVRGYLDDHGVPLSAVPGTAASILFLIITNGTNHRLINVFGSERLMVIESKTVDAPHERQRLAANHADLAGKRIAIVGCGSVGSKVAASLARSGGGHFLLLDPDIFFPANVVRNDLDLRSVAVSKSYAVKQRVLEINPTAEVITSTILLGGQESAESLRNIMSVLQDCDIILDATAEAHVFNLCAAVAKSGRKPLLWGEVLGGGLGGLVAMSRPDIDPPPLSARNQIAAWYANKNVQWDPGPAEDYEVNLEDQAPLIASDAEVALIAAHLTRFALDTLLRPGSSIFPEAAYVVGFAAGYIFDAPFETHPIAYRPEGAWGPAVEPNAADGVLELLKGLKSDRPDED